MALPTTVHGNSSLRANPEFACFLDLPGELRNTIYDLTLQKDEPIRIVGPNISYQPPKLGRTREPWPCSLQFGPNAGVVGIKPSLKISLTCRIVHDAVMSRFYKSNTFVLSKNINLHDPFGSFMNILTSVWLGNIGQQTSLIRNLVIDLDALCPVGCRGSWGSMSMEDSCFKSQDGLIEVQDLLRAVWNHNMDVVVTFIQPQSQAFQHMRHSASEYPHSNLALRCFVCNAAIITKVFESLMKDQLGLQKYGRLLGGVGIKRDGSGGSVTWTASHQHDKDYGHSCGARISGLSSCLEFQEDFIAEHGGTRLRMHNRPKASLMSLPSKLQHKIFAKIIVPTEPINIDLDRDTGFQQGLLHVHRDIYIRYWHTFIRESEFHVWIGSSEPTTSFSDFKPLQNLLRKHLNARSLFSIEVMPSIFHDGGMHLFAAARRPGRINIEMNFQLTSSMQLRELRIDILPFVMATSSLHGDRKVTISIANPAAAGDSNFDASQDIRLEDLRSKVYQALVEVMPTHAHVVDRVCPKIWINGLGDVVATDLADGPLLENCGIIAEPPDFLIDMLKGIGWRDYRCKICQPEDFGSLYPYNNQPRQYYDIYGWYFNTTRMAACLRGACRSI